MEGRKSPGETQTPRKVCATNPSDVKMQCAARALKLM